MDDVTFRTAPISDSSPLAGLVAQLGYPTTSAETERRLTRLLSHNDYATFVADASGQVVGLIGAYLGDALEFDARYGRLTGVVVDSESRGRRLGEALMHHVEVWLKSQGVSQLTLTSGSRRSLREAHVTLRAEGIRELWPVLALRTARCRAS